MDQLAVLRRIGLVRNKIGLDHWEVKGGKTLPFFLMWISLEKLEN
jgi:hypothetical protein